MRFFAEFTLSEANVLRITRKKYHAVLKEGRREGQAFPRGRETASGLCHFQRPDAGQRARAGIQKSGEDRPALSRLSESPRRSGGSPAPPRRQGSRGRFPADG